MYLAVGRKFVKRFPTYSSLLPPLLFAEAAKPFCVIVLILLRESLTIGGLTLQIQSPIHNYHHPLSTHPALNPSEISCSRGTAPKY